MADWWEPTTSRYLGRVSKALILDAVAEAVSQSAAENLSTLKKGALVAHAEDRLRGKEWLPAILRPKIPADYDVAESEIDPVPIAAE